MNWTVLRLLLASLLSVLMVGCTKRVQQMPTPAESGVDIYEVRSQGAALAPDSLKIYLTKRGDAITGSDHPVFEAQDAGSVCYQWIDTKELHIRISGGYVDNIEREWKGGGGHTVGIRYMGTEGCKWRPEK